MSFKNFMDFAYPTRLHDNHATFDIKDMEKSYNAGYTEGQNPLEEEETEMLSDFEVDNAV